MTKQQNFCPICPLRYDKTTDLVRHERAAFSLDVNGGRHALPLQLRSLCAVRRRAAVPARRRRPPAAENDLLNLIAGLARNVRRCGACCGDAIVQCFAVGNALRRGKPGGSTAPGATAAAATAARNAFARTHGGLALLITGRVERCLGRAAGDALAFVSCCRRFAVVIKHGHEALACGRRGHPSVRA
eukprot:349704-Chlamydomonas_euryale.AAC.5